MRLSERLEAHASSWPTVYESDRANIDLLREAAEMAKSVEEAKPVASRHLMDLGAAGRAWSRWMEPDDRVAWPIIRSEHAYPEVREPARRDG